MPVVHSVNREAFFDAVADLTWSVDDGRWIILRSDHNMDPETKRNAVV